MSVYTARPAMASIVASLTLLAGTAFGQVSQDLAFGVGGSARTGIANFTEVWNDAAVQADGRIIAVGSRSSRVGAGSSNFLIARLLPTGLPDTSFNGTGTIELDFGTSRFDDATSVTVLPDGKILVAGNSQKYETVSTPVAPVFGAFSDIAIVRLNANGTLDTTFGSAGFARVDLSSGLDDTVSSLIVLPSGGIRVVGNGTNVSASGNRKVWAITGLTASGAVEASFGTAGRKAVEFANGSSLLEATDGVLNNGKITVVGTDSASFVASRIDATTGAFDAGFGTGGIVTISFPPAAGSPPGSQTTRATAALVQSDGSTVIVGDGVFFDFNQDSFGSNQLFAVRLNAAGQVDNTFSGFPNDQLVGFGPDLVAVNGRLAITAGVTRIYSLNASTGAVVADSGLFSVALNGLAAGPDGKLVAAGYLTAGDALVQRFVIDGGVVVTPPAAPSNLGANLIAARSIGLVWRDNSTNETSFVVERSTSSSFANPVTVATLPANATTFTNGGLQPRTTYFYRVRAANSAGSSLSNVFSVTTLRR